MADTPTCLVEMCVLETTHSFFGKKSNEKENNDYQYYSIFLCLIPLVSIDQQLDHIVIPYTTVKK